jgi:hypothetical protein
VAPAVLAASAPARAAALPPAAEGATEVPCFADDLQCG